MNKEDYVNGNFDTFLLGLLLLETLLLLTLTISTVLLIGAKEVIPPAEGRCVVANEHLVMIIVMFSTSPERHPVVKGPREIITRMSINSLEKTKDNPHKHSSQMKIPLGAELKNKRRDSMVDKRTTHGTEAQDHSLDRMSVFSSDTKGSSVFVMNLVHLFVEWWPMHEAMHVIMIKVLENEKDSNLNSHLLPIEIFMRMNPP